VLSLPVCACWIVFNLPPYNWIVVLAISHGEPLFHRSKLDPGGRICTNRSSKLKDRKLRKLDLRDVGPRRNGTPGNCAMHFSSSLRDRSDH
jgi:hypothetical protein